MDTRKTWLPFIAEERLVSFVEALNKAFIEQATETLSLRIFKYFLFFHQVEAKEEMFSEQEIRAAIDQLSEDNQLMVYDGIIYRL